MSPITHRDEWHARYGKGLPIPNAVPLVVLHHSYRPALKPTASAYDEQRAVRAIERYHVNTNGWAGIAYNFLVAPSGRIYEGRGWGHRGAHAGDANDRSVGICLMIDGSETAPTPAMIAAVRNLVGAGVRDGLIEEHYQLVGHRDVMLNRTCPGHRVYAVLAQFRHDVFASGVALNRVTPPSTLKRHFGST